LTKPFESTVSNFFCHQDTSHLECLSALRSSFQEI
jgi:hypothetical protein